jgi:release factor glutamine methyltransferase
VIIQEALAFGRQQLTHSPDPTLDARLLLEYVLGKSHAHFAAHGEDTIPAVQEKKYRRLLKRAAQQEPIPYITGQAHFFDLVFKVSPAVLIPRPETEQLVETALKWAARTSAVQQWSGDRLKIVDVGTGSGCIAIALALAFPKAQIEAVDMSEPALAIARQNAHLHNVAGNIHFHLGSLLEPINGRPNLLIANLPYIADEEWTSLTDGVKSYEPVSALRGGPMGLDFIKQLLNQAFTKLSPGGAIFLEIGWQQGTAVKQLAQSIFPTAQVTLTADYAGNDRIISIMI